MYLIICEGRYFISFKLSYFTLKSKGIREQVGGDKSNGRVSKSVKGC